MRTETVTLESEFGGKMIIRRYCQDFISHHGINLGKPVLCSSIDDGINPLISDGMGIYHLFSGGLLSYVGVTNNFRRRIKEHLNSDKLFDAFLFFGTETHFTMKHLERIERKMIDAYKPTLNLK
jgi:hypothetical protein